MKGHRGHYNYRRQGDRWEYQPYADLQAWLPVTPSVAQLLDALPWWKKRQKIKENE